MAPEVHEVKKFVGLPMSVVGPVDIGRLSRELEAIDNNLMQQQVVKQEPKLPKTSKLMDQLIELNKVDLLNKAERTRLMQFLKMLKEKAPVIHISFSADPSPLFTGNMVTWLRDNIHPLVLLTVGLQPNIGAGCMVRTTNKYFDFSLARRFDSQRELLMNKLRETTTGPATAATSAPEAAMAEPAGVAS